MYALAAVHTHTETGMLLQPRALTLPGILPMGRRREATSSQGLEPWPDRAITQTASRTRTAPGARTAASTGRRGEGTLP